MRMNLDQCYDALRARDVRFDGRFFVGVSTTGIYCRPVCPSRTPYKSRCDFFWSAAAAEGAGYRPCLRCRPEIAPGRAPVDALGRLAERAIRRIEAGALDDGGVEALAGSLGVSSRQLRRAVEATFGASPIALAQTQRLLMAKRLLTETQLRVVDVASASGFGSVRRMNHLFHTRYRLSPATLRRARAMPADGGLRVKLAYRPPLAWRELLAFIAARGAASVEAVDGERYLRAVRLDNAVGWVTLAPQRGEAALNVTLSESLLPVLAPLLTRLRRLFDLDANPQVVDAQLSRDPRLRASIHERPGLRVPGAFDAFELALRAVLGQQVSVRGATTLYGRFVEAFGGRVDTPLPGITRTAPTAQMLAEASVDAVATLGLPRRRAQTIVTLARAFATGALTLAPGEDPELAREALIALPGIGDWTAQYLSMRSLADADAFPAGDLGVQRALQVTTARAAQVCAEAWRPWRAYAVMHLWQSHSGG